MIRAEPRKRSDERANAEEAFGRLSGARALGGGTRIALRCCDATSAVATESSLGVGLTSA